MTSRSFDLRCGKGVALAAPISMAMDKPAPKQVDDALFGSMPADIRALQQQARREQRRKQRAQFKQNEARRQSS